jgi:hypothetical protein
MNKDMPEDRKLSANFCTQLLGVFAICASFTSSLTVQKYNRRTLFIAG